MCGNMVHIQSATAEIRRGKRREKRETTAAKYNSLHYWVAITLLPTYKLVLCRLDYVNDDVVNDRPTNRDNIMQTM